MSAPPRRPLLLRTRAARRGLAVALLVFATLNGFRLEPYAALLSHLVTTNQPKFVLAVGSSRARDA